MALSGFQAKNHPQQTSRRWPDDVDAVDDRATHPLDFAEFSDRHGPFTLDVAAAVHNTKCDRYFTREQDGTAQDWAGERVWCNPPYSDIAPWIRKAWDCWTSTLGVTMLLPANRTEQSWWQLLVEPYRDRPGSPLTVEFLPGRMRFLKPGLDQAEVVDEAIDLRADDSAAASCRYCQTVSTAAGIARHEHGPDSRTCARMRERIRLEEATS